MIRSQSWLWKDSRANSVCSVEIEQVYARGKSRQVRSCSQNPQHPPSINLLKIAEPSNSATSTFAQQTIPIHGSAILDKLVVPVDSCAVVVTSTAYCRLLTKAVVV